MLVGLIQYKIEGLFTKLEMVIPLDMFNMLISVGSSEPKTHVPTKQSQIIHFKDTQSDQGLSVCIFSVLLITRMR